MADAPSGSKDQNGTPAPEVLKPKADNSTPETDSSSSSSGQPEVTASRRRMHRGSYRPSHKATFIGLAVVIIILGVNSVVIAFVLKAQNKKIQQAQGQVTISQAALDKVGINNTPIGTSGIELTVNPDARFNGRVDVAGDLSVGGQLKLSSGLSAGDASLSQLQVGNVSAASLNVNGNVTASTLNLRNDLNVAGTSRLQGPVTIGQLLTVDNSLDVVGNMAVGGVLSVGTFHTTTLVADNGVTIGGHVVTEGSPPSVTKGSSLAGTDTVSISGNDVSGTVAVNIGASSVSGIVANITFNRAFSNIPHVLITPVGSGASDVYVNRSEGGFSIGVGSLDSGGHAFDYIVEQ